MSTTPARSATPEVGAAPDGEWQRFHPLSPALRGGIFLIAVVGYLGAQFFNRITERFGPSAPDRPGRKDGPGDSFEASLLDHPLIAAAGVGLILVGIVSLAVASWWFTRYRLGETTIELRTGAIFRQHRQVPYARIQAVSIARPVLARLMGLSEVKVESAGGSDSHVQLAYLSQPDALALRDRLLGLADAARPGSAPAAGAEGDAPSPSSVAGQPAPEGPVLLRMSFGRLLASTLVSWASIFMLLAVVVMLVFSFLGAGAAFVGIIPPLIFAAIGRVRHLLTWANLVVRRGGEALGISHGLTDLSTWTVPVRRVQAFELHQPWMWRRFGWWRVSVNVAGVNIGGDQTGHEGVVVPVGTTAETAAVVEALTQGEHADEVRRAMADDLPEDRYASPRSARWLDPATWRHNGVVVGEDLVLIRRGWLSRTVQAVPHGRIQSMTLSQGPIQRRLDLAKLRLVSTVGAVIPVTPPLSLSEGERLMAVESGLASAARSRHPSPAPCTSAADSMNWTAMSADDEKETGQ